jgi:predicted TPR repeat methyltransferase
MDRDPTLKDAYRMSSQGDVKELYRVWAHSYDSKFGDSQGYQLPRAVAQAYLTAGGTGPVLDVGAGTGLVAEYLIRGGVDVIDALDLSDEMLGVARMKGFYRRLIAADVTAALPMVSGDYRGVVSAGTFTMGHVGPEGLIPLMDAVKSGTLFVISVNAAHFESAGFADAMNGFAAQIGGLTFADTRIYDDRADDGHRNDLARLIVFRKA